MRVNNITIGRRNELGMPSFDLTLKKNKGNTVLRWLYQKKRQIEELK
jgi:hypothetical protein